MGVAVPIKKLKVSELKALVNEIGLNLTGKEKKNEILTLLENVTDAKLNSMNPDELKAYAGSLGLDISTTGQLSESVALLKPHIDSNTIRTLMGLSAPSENNQIAEGENLEEIGNDLVEVEKDVENIIQNLEHRPAPDMADIYLIDQKLADVVKMNIDYGTVASMLDVGRIKFLDRKYVESMTMLTEALKASDDMINLYNDINLAFIILSAEKILEECRNSDSNDENAADALIHAKRSFSKVLFTT